MLAGVIFYYYGYYQSSQTVDDFPVPVSATLLKLSKDGSFEEYTWSLASEEDGLPSAYLAAIRLWGWEKAERMGGTRAFEKNGKQVSVTSLKDSLFINTPTEE